MEASAKDVATHYDLYKKLAELQTDCGKYADSFQLKSKQAPGAPQQQSGQIIYKSKMTHDNNIEIKVGSDLINFLETRHPL